MSRIVGAIDGLHRGLTPEADDDPKSLDVDLAVVLAMLNDDTRGLSRRGGVIWPRDQRQVITYSSCRV